MADVAKSMSQERGVSVRICETIEESNRSYAMGTNQDHIYYLIHVRKGKGEGEVPIENPHYEVSLDRSRGTRLGLKMDVQVATQSLFIREVMGGLAFQWNSGHSDSKVRPGDRIMKINDIEGDAPEMMSETKQTKVLNMQLLRGAAVPITPNLNVTVATPFCTLQLGQEGTVAKVDDEGDALMKFEGATKQWICKQDYNKFTFADTDRYVLKRFCDFNDLNVALKTKIDKEEATPVKELPDFPADVDSGFRRQNSNLGLGSFMSMRRDALQKYINGIVVQLATLDSEPVLSEFFSSAVPEVGAAKADVLKGRLETLVAKHQQLRQGKQEQSAE